MKCTIIASGDFDCTDNIKKVIAESELILCADGGARHLKTIKILPDILIGDFDSISKDDLSFFQKKDVEQINYPTRKDKTDSALCLQYALEHGAKDITFLGVTGSRMDHTLSNIFMLKGLAENKITARIINQNNEIHIITDTIELSGKPGQYISLIPVSEKVTGINLEGLEYTMEDGEIKFGSSLGVSNCLKKTKAKISIKTGFLIVIKTYDELSL